MKFLDTVRDNVIKFTQGIIKWFEQTPQHIMAVLDGIAFLFGRYLRMWWDLFTVWIPNIVKAVIGELEALPGQIGTIMLNVWNAVSSWLAKTWNDSVSWVSRMINDIGNWFAQLPGRVGSWLSQTWNAAVNWVARIWSDLINWVSRTVNDIGNWFAQLPGRIGAFFGSLFNSASNVGNGIYNGFKNAIMGLPNLVGDILNNVWKSITGMAGKLADGAKHVASSIWNSFKDGLGIHSPSHIERAFFAIQQEGDNTVNKMTKGVGKLADLSKKAVSVTMGNKGTTIGGVNSTMAFANLTLNGDINFQNKGDIDYFFQKLGRNVELTQQGLTALK